MFFGHGAAAEDTLTPGGELGPCGGLGMPTALAPPAEPSPPSPAALPSPGGTVLQEGGPHVGPMGRRAGAGTLNATPGCARPTAKGSSPRGTNPTDMTATEPALAVGSVESPSRHLGTPGTRPHQAPLANAGGLSESELICPAHAACGSAVLLPQN